MKDICTLVYIWEPLRYRCALCMLSVILFNARLFTESFCRSLVFFHFFFSPLAFADLTSPCTGTHNYIFFFFTADEAICSIISFSGFFILLFWILILLRKWEKKVLICNFFSFFRRQKKTQMNKKKKRKKNEKLFCLPHSHSHPEVITCFVFFFVHKVNFRIFIQKQINHLNNIPYTKMIIHNWTMFNIILA